MNRLPGVHTPRATFDRVSICTPWIDGNSVRDYFGDLTYTSFP